MAVTSMKLPDSFMAIDTETTGLDANNCEIIEIAIVEVRDSEFAGRFSTLVKPDSHIPSFITCITGIDDAMVANAPRIDDVIESVAEMLDGTVVVGHNVCFDSRFIQKAMSDRGLTCQYTMVDTLRLSRHAFADLESRTLDDIADACDEYIDYSGRHRALCDAELAARCAIAMRPIIEEKYGDDPDAALAKRTRVYSYIKPSDIQPTVSSIDESNPFFESHVLFTGKLSNMTRAEAMQKAVNLGAVPLNNFSKKVDYLVVGSFDFISSLGGKPSSKLKKAEKAIAEGASLQIVSESFFAEFAAEV